MRKILISMIVACAVMAPARQLHAWPQAGTGAPGSMGVLDVVVSDEQGKRMSGVLVALPGYRSTTGIGGVCRFSLRPGRYAILVRKSGYRGRRVNVGVRAGETTTAHVKLQKLPPGPSTRK